MANLSFKIPTANILRISGPNGTGKTTLIKIIAGLLKAQKGVIYIKSEARKIQNYQDLVEYLPSEGNGLFGELDAVCNLTFWSKLRGHLFEEKVINDELQRWGLGNKALSKGFPVEKFSTGMKRRLGLARVVLSGTKVWLLDEPLFGLDQESIGIFRKALEEHLQANGLAIMVSHDPSAFEGFQTLNLSFTPNGVVTW